MGNACCTVDMAEPEVKRSLNITTDNLSTVTPAKPRPSIVTSPTVMPVLVHNVHTGS